jgi:hypothetical protein
MSDERYVVTTERHPDPRAGRKLMIRSADESISDAEILIQGDLTIEEARAIVTTMGTVIQAKLAGG